MRAADLREVGIDPKRLGDYSRRGLADRVAHGVYRLRLGPVGEWDELMLAALWPEGRGVLSHETALRVHGLHDVDREDIEITVPVGYRTHRRLPTAYWLHPRELQAGDVTAVEGVPVVTPGRAIADGIELGLRWTTVEHAIELAQRGGTVTAEAAVVLRALRAFATGQVDADVA